MSAKLHVADCLDTLSFAWAVLRAKLVSWPSYTLMFDGSSHLGATSKLTKAGELLNRWTFVLLSNRRVS